MRGLALAALALAACEGRIEWRPPAPGAAAGDASSPPGPDAGPSAVPPLPSAALCENAPAGRGYLGLGGESLEADRDDRAAFLDVDRPYRVIQKYGDWSLMNDVRKAIGSPSYTDPEQKDPGVGASFGAPPQNWYQESEVGAFAVFTTFAFAFKACRRAIDEPAAAAKAGWYEYTSSAPTVASAGAYCHRAELEGWLREPNADEVQACVDLALDLADEPDVKNRWAYVCASIVGSANFLSY